MPGLSQLKKFSSDLLALGDEVVVRAGRGEKPVAVPIPKDVEDRDDSEDFIIGMPEGEELAEEEQIDDDLSDLAGISGASDAADTSGSSGDESASPFETPDMSGLLNPVAGGDFGGDEMPDLSMFADEPVAEPEPEEVVEEEPEEVAVADLGLDDLLAGGGFDEPEQEEESGFDDGQAFDDLNGGNVDSGFGGDAGTGSDDGVFGLDDFGELDDLEDVEEAEPLDDVSSDLGDFGTDFNDLGTGDVTDFSADDESKVDGVDNADGEGEGTLDDFFYEPFDDNSGSDEQADDVGGSDEAADNISEEIPAEVHDEVSDAGESFDDLGDFSDIGTDLGSGDDSAVDSFDDDSFNTDGLDNIDDFTEPVVDSNVDISEDLGAEPAADSSDDFEIENSDIPEGDFGAVEEPAESVDAAEDLDSLGGEDFGSDDFAEPGTESDKLDNIEEDVAPEELDERFADSADADLGSPFDDFSTEGLDELPEMSDLGELGGDAGEDAAFGDGLGGDTGSDFNIGDDVGSGAVDDFGLPVLDDNIGAGDITANDDIPDYGDYNLDDESGAGDDAGPIETFDTSEMEGLDFDIPDTDTQLGDAESASDDFELGDNFEIPGFSDVDTISENDKKSVPLVHNEKKQKNKKGTVNNAIKEESGNDEDTEKDNLPPNTLSDKQYKTFLKNLNEYPLNVRLAFEELLVKDEFTDDAEFEIIEIILNKAPAVQVAGRLEKMLDISIPVPRDYEHRSAGEYEAYKKSLSYQLKNKIIPAVLLGIVGILVCIGLFNFGKNCVYKPLKANSLYKQGYVLIQEREYPLSEIKFNEATNYRLSKKWFFKYAREYRLHKQYQRAGKMYQNILYCFNHDKEAGLEYADMELDDLANYNRAEEIVRREVLDYHINDADGMLKLGDIFLEWGTEKDPVKLEDAREQYAALLQMYGQEDLYLSRMMRYFIRTDNLREVLQLKQHFEPDEESLCSDDWTELSGYLLDKYYGELSPAEEYLRYEIEGLRSLLLRAVESNTSNPVALYNLSKYFINTNETEYIESTLQDSIEKFNEAKTLKNREIYKYIDAYRLLGEYYVNTDDFLQAQEQFAEGIALYITERDNAGFKGNKGVGKLYEDMGNLKYTISGDYEEALLNYRQSVNLGNDSPAIRYRIGYVQYHNRDYEAALSAFMKAGDGNIKERNLLLAMANTLSIRGDDYAAEGYYDQLIETLDTEIANRGLVLPQANEKDYNIVNTYLCASNNYGVTLYRLAKKTGDSGKNAEAIVQFSESLKAWDALTRNPETMIKLEGTNLAEQNIKYITHPISEFEPAIYTSIPKTLLDNEGI